MHFGGNLPCEQGGERSEDDSLTELSSSSEMTNTGGTWPWRKRKQAEICMSHRHIEKRRRDRINRTLMQLKDLVPTAMQKFKDRAGGRLEKAELLEMTIDYLQQLQAERSQMLHCKDGDPLLLPETEVKAAVTTYPDDRYIQGFKDGVAHVLQNIKELEVFRVAVAKQSSDCCREKNKSTLAPMGSASSSMCTLYDLADIAVQRQSGATDSQFSEQRNHPFFARGSHGIPVTDSLAVDHGELGRRTKPCNVVLHECHRALKKEPESPKMDEFPKCLTTTGSSAALSSPLVAKVAPITTCCPADFNQVNSLHVSMSNSTLTSICIGGSRHETHSPSFFTSRMEYLSKNCEVSGIKNNVNS